MPLTRHVGIHRPLESVDKKKHLHDLSDAMGQKKRKIQPCASFFNISLLLFQTLQTITFE